MLFIGAVEIVIVFLKALPFLPGGRKLLSAAGDQYIQEAESKVRLLEKIWSSIEMTKKKIV